jgi:hypothetical protein
MGWLPQLKNLNSFDKTNYLVGYGATIKLPLRRTLVHSGILSAVQFLYAVVSGDFGTQKPAFKPISKSEFYRRVE